MRRPPDFEDMPLFVPRRAAPGLQRPPRNRQLAREWRRSNGRPHAFRDDVAALRWLEAAPIFEQNRIVWRSTAPTPHPSARIGKATSFLPTINDFATAQRALNDLERLRQNDGAAFARQWKGLSEPSVVEAGSEEAWLEACRRRLNAARRLHQTAALEEPIETHNCVDADAAERWALWLEAESLCGEMPSSPCRILWRMASVNAAAVRRALRRLSCLAAHNDDFAAGQWLAAALWGALDRREAGRGRPIAPPAQMPPALQCAYNHARADGRAAAHGCREMLENWPLWAALKYFDASEGMAGRIIAARAAHPLSIVGVDVVKSALWRGCDAHEILDLVTAGAAFAPLLYRVAGWAEQNGRQPPFDEANRASFGSSEESEFLLRTLRDLTKCGLKAQHLSTAVSCLEKWGELEVPASLRAREMARLVEAGCRIARARNAEAAAQWFRFLERHFELLWPHQDRPIADVTLRRSRWQQRQRRANHQWNWWLETRRSCAVLPVETLLSRGHDSEWVVLALHFKMAPSLAREAILDARQIELWRAALQTCFELQGEDKSWRLRCVVEHFLRFDNALQARKIAQPLLEKISVFPAKYRVKILDDWLDIVREASESSSKTPLEVGIARLLWVVGKLPPEEIKRGPRALSNLLRASLPIVAQAQSYNALDGGAAIDADTRVEWLIGRWCALHNAKPSRILSGQLDLVSLFAGAMAGGDEEKFRRLMESGFVRECDIAESELEQGLGRLRFRPVLSAALAHEFERAPRQAFDFLHQLSLYTDAEIIALDELESKAGIAAPPNAAECPWLACWNTLQSENDDQIGSDEVSRPIELWRRARRLAGQSMDLPPNVAEVFDWPRRWQNECAHLAAQLSAGGDGALEDTRREASLRRRLENLERRLQNRAALHAAMRIEIIERLGSQWPRAIVLAARMILRRTLPGRMQQIVGKAAAKCEGAHKAMAQTAIETESAFEDDQTNAVLLMSDIRSNRRLLRRMLRAEWSESGANEENEKVQDDMTGAMKWRFGHPVNARFLAGLSERGVDVEQWVGERRRGFRCVGATSDKVLLWLEIHPLRVLQMGNFFETCLSRGDINSFSTVANACELNKRVIYACDGEKRIVGRQLIGLNEEGEMVGFHVYTSLKDGAANARLREIFGLYARSLARDCRLSLGNAGTVPRLFAQRWYDDGVEKWHEILDARRLKSASQSANARRRERDPKVL